MTSRIGLLILAAGIATAPLVARADEPALLRFATTGPLTSLVYLRGIQPWVKSVENDSTGTVEIKMFPGGQLADVAHIYDATISGVADLTTSTYGPISSDFPRTLVTTLPFENRNTYEATLALWRLIESGPIAQEYGRVKPIVVYVFPDTRLHTNKPVKTIEDVAGMKLTASTRVVNQTVSLLGAVPISMPPNDIYQALQRRLVDGAATAWTAVYPFKLDEVSSYHYETSLGMEPGFVFMNKASYARLPEKARQAVDRHSGEVFAKRMGDAVAVMEQEGRDRVKALPGHVVAEMPDAEAERWRARIVPVIDEWVKRTPDGATVLAAYRAELAKIRAEPR